MAQPDNKQKKFKLSLEDTGLSKRIPSWVLFVAILALFLLIPLASLLNKDTATALRNSPLPSDNSWISGHLSKAHQIPELNQNCEACHTKSFEMVQDSACVECHSAINHHFDTTKHDIAQLSGERCASCHHEHEQPEQVVREDDRLCVSCHGDMVTSGATQSELVDVDGFGKEHKRGALKNPHPKFKVSMLFPSTDDANPSWSLQRVALADKPKEKSNLVFPHDVHLDPAGIESPSGDKVLQCNDCHVNDDAGKLMQPVTMENNCRECHSLVFDQQAPDREVPHGDPDTVMLTLQEYYSRQFLMNKLGRAPTEQELQDFILRRPGTTVERRVEQSNALANPWSKADIVAQEIFEKTTCKTCHEISIDNTGKHLSKWRVKPIRLTSNWMPKSDFEHFSHKTFDCGSCHAAEFSSEASDVLMPDLDNCESCHTGSRTHENKSPTSCIACHDFHLPNQKAWTHAITDFSKPEEVQTN